MHDNKIIHADIGCNNWILVQGHLRLLTLRVEALMVKKQERAMSGSVTRNRL
jgi:tRNA A-37 threonylcarbamoyl transferase component Bud32